MENSDWFGGALPTADPWNTAWDKTEWDNTEDTNGAQGEDIDHPLSLRSLDTTFITGLCDLKHHCYDITVTNDPLDSERAQSMAPLQDYIIMLSTVHMILLKAPYDTEQQKSLPASVQIKLAPLLEWIRRFCETHRDPIDRIPYQSHLTTNLKENPFIQKEQNNGIE
jgi:hypothetical protein